MKRNANAKQKRTQQGLTLIEVSLVFAIAMLIIIMGLRQFQAMRVDSNVQQVRANVDTIFQAMAFYYRANCYGTFNPNATPPLTPGTLNPDVNPPALKDINIQTDLVNTGLLQSTVPTVVPLNPIVSATGPGTSGYIAQFNLAPATQRQICNTSATGSTGPTPAEGCTSATVIATIINWKAQVAVKLADTSSASQFLRLLNGDCLSSLDPSNKVVRPCSSNPPIGPYVVWERLPSMAAPGNISDYWMSNPTLKQFEQMYTTYPVTFLMSVTPPGSTPSGTQYILCGS